MDDIEAGVVVDVVVAGQEQEAETTLRVVIEGGIGCFVLFVVVGIAVGLENAQGGL